jgi:hypothetical protein
LGVQQDREAAIQDCRARGELGYAPATLRGHRLRDRMYSVFPNPPTPADMLNVDEIYR